VVGGAEEEYGDDVEGERKGGREGGREMRLKGSGIYPRCWGRIIGRRRMRICRSGWWGGGEVVMM